MSKRRAKAPVTLSLEVTSRSYATSEMNTDDFIALCDYDDECQRGDTLFEKLNALGCTEVEYNGHFGAHVYFTLAVGDDTDEKRAAILETIENRLKEACKTNKVQS